MNEDMQKFGMKFLIKRKRYKRWQKIVGVFACLVVFCTAYALILPAVTLEKITYCGKEEHKHDETCYTKKLICELSEEEVISGHAHTGECYQQEKVLGCGLDESGEHTHTEACYTTENILICDQEEQSETSVKVHTHTDECYEQALNCSAQEHTHTLECYSDDEADLETAAVWEKSLPVLTGNWASDLILVAESQVGYRESEENYKVTEANELKGYTRYGDWYGNPYGDWSGMFAAFCINYSAIPQNVFPYDEDCGKWADTLSENGMFADSGSYTPKAGDLVFLDADEEQGIDHVGIIKYVSEDGKITTVEGDSQEEVRYGNYALTDGNIEGYGILPIEENTENPAEKTGDVPDEKQKEEQSRTMTAAGDDYTVRVKYTEEAAIPEGAVLEVSEYSPDSEEYQSRFQEANEALLNQDGSCIRRARFFNISIMDSGEEIEPSGMVQVEITQSSQITEKTNELVIAHAADEGTEFISEVELTRKENGDVTASFETDSFSDYGTITAGQSITIGINDTITLKGSSGNKNVWTVDSEGYVEIADNGNDAVITGTAAGTVTITHVYTKKGASESFTVIVAAADDSDTEKEAEGQDYTITVKGNKKILTDDVELHVEDYNNSESDYQDYYNALIGDLQTATSSSVNDGSFDFLRMYHIYLTKTGVEGEYIPEGNVNLQVTITYSNKPAGWEKVNWVGHYKKVKGSVKGQNISDGNSSANGVKQIRVAGNSITFHIKSFSVFPIAALGDNSGGTVGGTGVSSSADGSILTSDQLKWIGESSSNEWQIVDQEYAGNAGENKKESDDKKVRVQKNVMPTDVENEFLIYLAIDTKQLFEDFFASAEYMATTSNNYHDKNLGTVVTAMTGNQNVQVGGNSTTGSNHANFTILSSTGELLAENITLYWSQANNVTFYLKVNDGDEEKYILTGVKVGKNNQEVVMLSEEAERLIMSNIAQMARLDEVKDTMGDYVEFVSVVSGDYDTTPVYDSNTRTLTWIPAIKENPTIDKVRTDESKTVTWTDHDGNIRTETVYKYTSWALNASELVYKVKLNVAKEGFHSTANNMNSGITDSESYKVNDRAVLTYGGGSTIDFQIPYVRGMLYDLEFEKVDKNNKEEKLSGAVFELTDNSGKTYSVSEDENNGGTYRAENLPWGIYTLTEKKPPVGYKVITDENTGNPVTWEISVCYTRNKDNLVQDSKKVSNMLFVKDSDQVWRIENERIIYADLVKTDMTYDIRLDGAKFSLYDTDPSGENAKPMKGYENISVNNGMIADNIELEDKKTYYIVETKAPEGYTLPEDNIIRLTVDMSNQAYPITVEGGAGKTDLSKETQEINEDEITVYVIKIPNNPGATLPQTGGAGTTLYTLCGLSLILAALMYGYIMRRRKDREQLCCSKPVQRERRNSK